MPLRKTTPKQKPKPSKEVLVMVKAVKGKKATCRRRVGFGQVALGDKNTYKQ